SLIRQSMVRELNLEERRLNGGYLVDGAGGRPRQYVEVPDVLLDTFHWGDKVDFVVMPGESDDDGGSKLYAGTIGLNFLSVIDLEIDGGKKRIGFFLPTKCEELGAYWADAYTRLPLEISEGSPPIARAQLDDESIRVLLDTGSTISWMSLDTAR